MKKKDFLSLSVYVYRLKGLNLMKRKYLVLMLTIFVVAVASSISYVLINNSLSPNSNNKVAIIDLPDFPKETIKRVYACYGDGSFTLKEMKDKAKQIVSGVVLEQKQFSQMSVVSTVKVTDTIRGKDFDSIEIYQLGRIGDEEVLSEGTDYILFLGIQGGNPDENEFYIVGGIQGIFTKKDDDIKAFDYTMANDLKKISQEDKIKSKTEFFDNFMKN